MEEPQRINDEPNDSVVPDPAGPSEPAESDSEDEHTHPNNADEPSIRRKQNLRFKELLSARAEEITAEDIKEVIKATKDDELSMSNLLAKQDFASVIHDPREYQVELFEKAKKDNIIAVLDTGIIGVSILYILSPILIEFNGRAGDGSLILRRLWEDVDSSVAS
ncbi:hypothetical protein CISG_01817 [Coccidioides immitis RMSCC 3703]|uniref:Uncharacterized protein n=2 Tax=Coccidioides immitis TaxID=5501 RepID=A0A0J8TXS3_COCIT|nr:hypothetical protein CIRG_08465 [Coccidioides immitis RMSCC 2394]KMU78777.1 hypothetical protein CISG_01817 [Coccidioides immitis RMSCC 3703]